MPTTFRVGAQRDRVIHETRNVTPAGYCCTIKTETFHSAMRADVGWGSHHEGHALEIDTDLVHVEKVSSAADTPTKCSVLTSHECRVGTCRCVPREIPTVGAPSVVVSPALSLHL